MQQQATELNIGFVSRMSRGLPWVRLKAAASLDGQTALADGSSQWITGEAAREDGHRWRARACAILTGIGTVREDDPRMTVRAVQTPRQPLRVVVDSRLEVDPHARILAGGGALVVHALPDRALAGDKERELRERGCELLHLPNGHGKVDLPRLFGVLADRGINEVHVEAGAALNGSLIGEGCVDEVLLYLAPSLLGRARGLWELAPPQTLAQRQILTFIEATPVGEDLRIRARFASPAPAHAPVAVAGT